MEDVENTARTQDTDGPVLKADHLGGVVKAYAGLRSFSSILLVDQSIAETNSNARACRQGSARPRAGPKRAWVVGGAGGEGGGVHHRLTLVRVGYLLRV